VGDINLRLQDKMRNLNAAFVKIKALKKTVQEILTDHKDDLEPLRTGLASSVSPSRHITASRLSVGGPM